MIEKIKNLSLSTKILILVAIIFSFSYLKTNLEPNYKYSQDSMSVSGNYPETMAVPSKMSSSPTRKVTITSYFSLLVKNVTGTVEGIKNKATETGGFYINANITRSDNQEQAQINVRIPTEKLESFKDYLRANSIKVVSENVVGNDITDQYTDYEARLSQLNNMKSRLENIFAKAQTVEDMMNIQQQLFYIQDQIDSIKGQLMYMEKSVSTTQISINLSTDELGLPYTPEDSWRPAVIFKQAVRSLLKVIQGLGTVSIWLLVFSPFIAVFFIIKKLLKR